MTAVPSEDAFQASRRHVRAAGYWLRKLFTTCLALVVGVLVVLVVLTAAAELCVLAGVHVAPGTLHGLGMAQVCYDRACSYSTRDEGMATFIDQVASQKLAYYMLVNMVRCLPPLLILWRLRALCGLYQDGVVFSRDSVRHIRWVGVWLLAWAVSPTLAHLALEPFSADLQGLFKSWFGPSQVLRLLCALIAFLAAQVVQLGRDIDEERSQFV